MVLRLAESLPAVEGLSPRGLKARLARGAAGAVGVNAAGMALAFLANLVLARLLGATEYGIYAYVIAWTTLLGSLASLGLPTVVLRFAASYHAKEQWSLLHGVVRYAERRVLLAGLAVFIGGAAVVALFGESLPRSLSSTLYVGFALIPLLALLELRSAVVRTLGRIVSALVPLNVVRYVVVLAIMLILGVGAELVIGAPLAMVVMLIGVLVSVIAISVAMHRARPAAMAKTAASSKDHQAWRRAAIPLFVMAGTQILLNRADVLMLGWLVDTTTAGIYSVASRIAGLTSFALIAINAAFAPMISALYTRGEIERLQNMVTTAAWWTIAVALSIALPLFVLSEFALRIFGEAFVSGAPALRILLLGQVVSSAAGSVGYITLMTGHERQAAVIFGAAAVANAVMNGILIAALGMNGAAVATSLTMAGWNVAFGIFVWRRLRIVPGVLRW
jgi:O-antigen/teichoic acid export membrane protein